MHYNLCVSVFHVFRDRLLNLYLTIHGVLLKIEPSTLLPHLVFFNYWMPPLDTTSSSSIHSLNVLLHAVLKPVELLILHWNDVHARVLPQNSHGSTCSDEDAVNCSGGWAKIGGMIETLCQTRQECLLLDAGDEFSGSMFSTAYKGWEAAQFLNMIQPDAFVSNFSVVAFQYRP